MTLNRRLSSEHWLQSESAISNFKIPTSAFLTRSTIHWGPLSQNKLFSDHFKDLKGKRLDILRAEIVMGNLDVSHVQSKYLLLILPLMLTTGTLWTKVISIKKCHVICSWHQKNETTNSPIHEFKVLQNVF